MCSAPKRCFSTARVGMYLNWNRSGRNTASTAHTHTRIPKHYLSVRVVAWAQDKGTQAHDAEFRPSPCRAQPLICVHFKMYYCTPPVCVPNLLGALAVWWQNINIYIYV